VTNEQDAQAASLMRLAQAGDQLAYASLLALLTGIGRRFVRARVGPAPWLDDVVQETLIAVHGARHTYDPARPFGPWFYTIASSRLIDALRRERRVSKHELAGDELPYMAATERAGNEIDVEAIRAAVSALSPRQREVIEQLKFQDRSVRDVAGRLNMTESAVKVTAHRGYRVLRKLLGASSRED